MNGALALVLGFGTAAAGAALLQLYRWLAQRPGEPLAPFLVMPNVAGAVRQANIDRLERELGIGCPDKAEAAPRELWTTDMGACGCALVPTEPEREVADRVVCPTHGTTQVVVAGSRRYELSPGTPRATRGRRA